jgi:radical SAM protein with 4Fe4S-binding SPASM domain
VTAPARAPRCEDDRVIERDPSADGGRLVAQAQEWAYANLVPLNATIEITQACNIRCLHCYNFDRGGPAPDGGPMARPAGDCGAPELSAQEILRLLGDLRDAGCLFLSLTGGEVLAHPELFAFLDRARDLNMAVQLLSNGTLLRPGMAARLATYSNLLGVSVSIYGATSETHDGITQAPGSWRRTWAGVDRLRARGVSVRLKLIIMRQNAHEVAAMRAMADARGCPYLVDVTITARHDGTRGSLTTRIGHDDLEGLYRGPLRDLVPLGRRPVGEEDFPCNCARGNCAISARGEVYPCISVPWPAGNVRERPFREIWAESPVFQRIRGLRVADYPSCAPCPHKSHCTRNRGAAFNASGSYTGTDPFVCATAELAHALADERSAGAAHGEAHEVTAPTRSA